MIWQAELYSLRDLSYLLRELQSLKGLLSSVHF